MNSLSALRFEVWIDGAHEMMSIRGERPKDLPGLRWIWFVLSRSELDSVCSGKVATLEDGYHKAIIHGDQWTFYDFEIPLKTYGEVKCPFVRVDIPRTFLKALYRLVKKTWNKLHQARNAGVSSYDLPRVVIEPSATQSNTILRLYGAGKGEVEWHMDDATRIRLDECKGAGNFDSRLEQIETIARNSTRGFHQRAHVRIYKDLDGFFWKALNPKRQEIMHGGIVNHSREPGKFDWSIHT